VRRHAYTHLALRGANLTIGLQMRDFYNQVLAGCGAGGLLGHKRFHLSDYSVHSRASFSFSLHCFSNRTLNTECVNGEGLQNRAIGDGALFLHVTGREFVNHPPVWIWSLLPSVTSLQSGLQYSCDNAQITDSDERRSFVGAATDGWSAVACMDFFRIDVVSNASLSLSARKMWAFFDDAVLSVTAGIQPSNASANVTTGIEQRILDGR
jgi:chondroitin AC lyase